MLDNKKYTGNRTDTPDFLKVLLTLKKNIMRDLNVAEVCKVLEVNNNVYTVVSINNNNLRLKCTKLSSLNPKKDDLVLVVFTNTDYRLNLSKTNKPFQNLQEETLHSLNYGIITGSLGEGSSIGIGTRVTVNGIFQPTWNADVKADQSELNITNQNVSNLDANKLNKDLSNVNFPIGYIYLSTDSTSPASLFGGTWEQIKDKFLLASGDIYSNGATGGEATHTLTIDEMPTHNHTINKAQSFNYSASGSYKKATIPDQETGNLSWVTTTSNVGGTQPHNNMPPYLVVYIWKRIA